MAHATNEHTGTGPARRSTPRWLGRIGWSGVLTLRRAFAAVLVLFATVLVLHDPGPTEPTVEVVVAARDLAPGSVVHPDDLHVHPLPSAAVPDGALRDPAAATGRVLGGAVRRGQPITDVALVGRELTELATGTPDAAAVPLRLPDAGIADLLHPGSRVDLVSTPVEGSADLDDHDHTEEPNVLAAGAVVLAVRPPGAGPADRERLVLVGLPRTEAARVALASLSRTIAITLR